MSSPPPSAPPTAGFGSSAYPAPSVAPLPRPTPPPAPAAPITSPVRHHDPKVAELQVMFPTVDVGVIEIVLESVGGSQDRAIEQLLSITDENFRPEETPATRREAESQVDLDAEFARSLQLEDEQASRQFQAQSQRYDQQSQAQTGHTSPGAGGLPYQPRVRRNQPAQGGQSDQYGSFDHDRYSTPADGPPAGAGAGMLQVEEKLQRAAEAGKQTFNNLFSLAKTKYAEFQSSQAAQQSQRASGGTGTGGLWQGEQQQQQYGYQQSAQGGQPNAAGWGRGGFGGTGVGGGRGGVQNRDGYGQGQYGQDDSRSFSTRSESISSASESTVDRDPPPPSDPRPVIRPSSNRWNPSDTYDDPLPPGRSTPTGVRDGFGAGSAGRKSPAPGAGVGSPESRGPAKIDASKLGILPKKKVDLLSTSPSASSPVSNANTGTQGGDLIDTSSPHPASSHADPNPGIPGASASVISKIPPTPPGKNNRATFGLEDSDDELEYTRSPFDER